MSATHTTRRRVALGVSLAAAAALLAGCSAAEPTSPSTDGTSAPQLSGQIIWADFGGKTNEARQSTYFDAFTADTGVEVTSVMEEDSIMHTMLYEAGDGDYDAIHVGLDDVYAYKDNVIQIPEEYQDTNLPENIRAYTFGTFYVGHAMGYLTATYAADAPTTWADFWNVDKYPGKRAWPGSPGSYDSTCEIAELAAGIAPDKLYPLDFDLCSQKLDELRPSMVFYSSYPEIQQLLSSGTAVMAMGPSGQFATLNAAGTPVTVSWDHAIVAPNVIAIPKNAPDKDNILALTAYFHDPEKQAAFSALTNYGPGNPDAYQYIDAATQDKLVNAPSHTTVVYQDSEWRAEHKSDLLDWYTAWLAG